MRARTIVLIALAVAVTAAPVPAVGKGHPSRVKTTRRSIESIGMDGPIVAYDLHAAGTGCNEVFTWNLDTNGGRIVSGDGTCDADSSSTGSGVTELAVAGRRVAWIVNTGGNTEGDDDLYSSSLPRPKEKHLLSAMRTGDVDRRLDGDWIQGLGGDGDLLAVSTFTTQGSAVTREALRVVGPTSVRRIARGRGTTTSSAVGAGRIAVVRDDGKVALCAASGSLLHLYPTQLARDAALTQHTLVVLSAKGLQVFGTGPGGPLLHTWHAPGDAISLGAEGDVAVYSRYCQAADTCGREVDAVRLSTGKTVRLARTPHDVVGLQIEAPGVVYAYDGGKGTIVFRPAAQVEASLR
jgi:hypothetical protein